MPEAFLIKAQDRLKSLQGQGVDSTADVYAYFYKTANQLTDFLHGGKVLYNDQVSQYLSQVMDSLLIAEPDLRASLQVFAVRDLSPKAAVTPDGLVLVNLGLLAQVENEAELAFVISHEISHYARKHAFRRLSESSATLLNGSDLARDLYNQAQEREADQAGFTRILRTRYKPTAALRVFSRLSDGGEFPNRPLDLAWLAPRGLPLPQCGDAPSESPEMSSSNPIVSPASFSQA